MVNYGRAQNDDEGVAVTRIGFRALKYARGDRAATIDVEVGNDDLGVYARSVDHWDGTGVTISENERAAILEDVATALRLLTVPFKLLWV